MEAAAFRPESAVVVRPYRLADRDAVRQICCDTADRGRPLGPQRDRELFADVVTSYYTDFEPESVWVADRDGEVVGYLTGAINSARCLWVNTWFILRALWRALWRNRLADRETWSLLGTYVKVRSQSMARRDVDFKQYPAHLHINLKAGNRGQHVGQRLVEAFLQRLRDLGSPGVFASTRDDNPGACRFFERLGFTALSRRPLLKEAGTTINSVYYGKKLP